MIVLLLLLTQSQAARVINPPQHQYVAQVTVPMQQDGLTLQLDNYPSDSRVIAYARGWTIYEICALADAGDGAFLVTQGMRAPAGALSVQQLAANTPGLVRLKLADSTGTQVFSLTGQPRLAWHRQGNVMRTSYHHIDLGRFGWAQVWITMRAGVEQLDFVLQLHNGIPGPDRRLNWAKIASRLPWTPTLPDPAIDPPYLIEPGNHVIPQQFARPFRFSVGTPEPEHVGVADWSQGGFLPAAFPVPALTYSHAGALAEARWRLATLAPAPAYGPTPTSALWPANGGATQTDEGGGQDRLPLLGVRWAATGDPAALELYQIEQLRSQSRARRRWGPDGLPMQVPAVATWSFFDGFLQGQDAPWEWDAWPQQWSPPHKFQDHGLGSLVRSTNDNLALAWLANDPLARANVLESATRARLTFPSVPPCTTPGLGTDLGGFHAQAALAMIAARALGDHQHDGWLQQYVDHMRVAQMPSGIIVAREGGYPSANAPFFGQYLLSGGSELATTMLALHSIGGADDVVRNCARGLVNLATDDDDPGFYYFYPVGPVGSNERYLTEDDWPTALHDAMGVDGTSSYYSPWDVGYAVELTRGTPEFLELFRRFTNWSNPATWGLTAPWGSVPIEQWYPILR